MTTHHASIVDRVFALPPDVGPAKPSNFQVHAGGASIASVIRAVIEDFVHGGGTLADVEQLQAHLDDRLAAVAARVEVTEICRLPIDAVAAAPPPASTSIQPVDGRVWTHGTQEVVTVTWLVPTGVEVIHTRTAIDASLPRCDLGTAGVRQLLARDGGADSRGLADLLAQDIEATLLAASTSSVNLGVRVGTRTERDGVLVLQTAELVRPYGHLS